jgi:hypothetical protein
MDSLQAKSRLTRLPDMSGYATYQELAAVLVSLALKMSICAACRSLRCDAFAFQRFLRRQCVGRSPA